MNEGQYGLTISAKSFLALEEDTAEQVLNISSLAGASEESG